MAMMGFPAAAEYRVRTAALPGSLMLELIEFRGVGETKSVSSRVQDAGSYRLQLNVRDIDQSLAALKDAGARVRSHGWLHGQCAGPRRAGVRPAAACVRSARARGSAITISASVGVIRL